MSLNVHVIECTIDPNVAPTFTGQHWINSTTGQMWFSNGTASVANWVLSDTDTDIKVSVSANDTTPGFLDGKLVAGSGITLTEQNDGGNETLEIKASGSALTDEKVGVSSNDTTPGYLLDKITTADESNTTDILEIKEVNDGGDEDLKIAIDETKIDHDNLLNYIADEHHASGSDNQDLFKTINTPAGTDPVADSQTDTLNLTSSDTSITITGDASTDTVDFKVDTSITDQNLFETINTPSGTNPVADSVTDTLNLTSSDSSVDITGDASTDTVDFKVANPNKFTSITGDSGTATADTNNDSMKIEGGTNITTTASETPDKVVVDWAADLDDLGDVNASSPADCDLLKYDSGTGKWINTPEVDLDDKVKVSSNDTTPGFLNGKLVAGSGITLTEQNDGLNETLEIKASGSALTDELVGVSSNDTTPGYLLDKIIASDESNTTSILEIKEVNDGFDEDLKIALDETKIDHDNLLNFVADEHHASGSDNQNLFETINTPNGTDPVADSQTDTLNLTSSDNSVTITGDATTDTVDFVVNTTVDDQNLFETVNVPNGTNPVADSATDTLNLTSADNSVTITGDATTDTVDMVVDTSVTDQNLFETMNTPLGTNPVADSATDTLNWTSSDGSVDITGDATTDTIDVKVNTTNNDQNLFETVATPLGTNPVADSPTDTLTYTSSDGSVDITGDATTDTIDLKVNTTNNDQNLFETINVPNGTNPVADGATDTLNLTSTDTSVTITGDATTDTINLAVDTSITDQNLFQSVTGDTGTATADNVTDTIKLEGGNKITTTASDSPDKVVIDWAANLDDLTDVDATSPSDDDLLQYNSGTGNWENVPVSSIATPDELVKISANDTTAGYLEDKVVSTEGIQQNTLNDGFDEDLELKLDINGLTEDTNPALSTDYIATYDASAGVHKKILLTAATGEEHQAAFFGQGSTGDKWLALGASAKTSDDIPYIVMDDVEINGFTWSNDDPTTDIDIEIYKNGTAPGNLLASYNILNKKTTAKSDITPVSCSHGDRISVYIKRNGVASSTDPVVTLYVKVVDRTNSEVST